MTTPSPGSGPHGGHLIVSDDQNPAVRLEPGKKYEVVSVILSDAELKAAQPNAARLCGGTSTCIALVELD